ncbi:MAG: hypothetical protein JWL95_2258, partial [Gemmatimonadetes bacterium]|nr:hypothetical protein [Gemmatimonadota bacterium]
MMNRRSFVGSAAALAAGACVGGKVQRGGAGTSADGAPSRARLPIGFS